MQDGRINVLHIVGNARLGGVASCLMNYFRRTDTRKFRFDFVTYAPSEFDGAVHEVDASAKVYHISPFQKNFLKGIFGMEKICKNNDYKVVHSHLTTLSAFCLSAAAMLRSCPVLSLVWLWQRLCMEKQLPSPKHKRTV